MVDTEVLSLPFDRGEGAHGHTGDGVGGQELAHHRTLVVAEVQTDVVEGSLL